MEPLDVILATAGVVAAAGAVALANQVAPRSLRAQNAVLLTVAIAAVSATFAPARPTGVALWDAVLVAAFAGASSLAARLADRHVVLAACVVGTVIAVGGGSAVLVAAAALGIALAGPMLTLRLPAAKAASGGLLANALIRSTWPAGVAALLPATLTFGALAIGALARSSPAARRRIAVAAAVLGSATVAATVALGALAVSARSRVDAGVEHARAGLAAARSGLDSDAGALLRAAAADFAEASTRLDSWVGWPARLVPVVAQNAETLRVMASHGEHLAAVGADAVDRGRLEGLRVSRGGLDLAALESLASPVRRARGVLVSSIRDLRAARSSWLVTPLREALDRVERQVGSALNSAETAADALHVIPDLFGARGPRRYFVAIQNNSESRALGGIIGNFAIVVADGGRMRLDQVGRGDDLNRSSAAGRTLLAPRDYRVRYARYFPEQVWQNVTMSPDGPSVARVIEGLYPQSGGTAVDGVVFLDPFALSRLLLLTGPVRVASWPEELTAENTARVLLHEQYLRFPKPERVEFLNETARAVFDRLVSVDLPGPAELGRALGPAIAGRHLALHSVTPSEQRFFRRAGLGGALPEVQGDFMALVTQNASANKVDYFLRRSLRYDVSFNPDTSAVSAVAELRLENGAPASGLPSYILGGAGVSPTPPGASRLIVSVYSALGLRSASLDGHPTSMDLELEEDRSVYSILVTVPPGAAAVLRLELAGEVVSNRGSYRLDVRRQPTVVADQVDVSVTASKGWRATSPSSTSFVADRDHQVAVRFRRL